MTAKKTKVKEQPNKEVRLINFPEIKGRVQDIVSQTVRNIRLQAALPTQIPVNTRPAQAVDIPPVIQTHVIEDEDSDNDVEAERESNNQEKLKKKEEREGKIKLKMLAWLGRARIAILDRERNIRYFFISTTTPFNASLC